MDIGNQIRERRQRLGLSQDELAQRLYVSRVTISHWETNKTLPDVQSMLLLANLFGTTIDEMVRGDVDEMREMVEKSEQQRKAFVEKEDNSCFIFRILNRNPLKRILTFTDTAVTTDRRVQKKMGNRHRSRSILL